MVKLKSNLIKSHFYYKDIVICLQVIWLIEVYLGFMVFLFDFIRLILNVFCGIYSVRYRECREEYSELDDIQLTV
jgi:hypothetical protein